MVYLRVRTIVLEEIGMDVVAVECWRIAFDVR